MPEVKVLYQFSFCIRLIILSQRFSDPDTCLKVKFQMKGFFCSQNKCITSGVSAIGCKWPEKLPSQQVPVTTAATKACTINYY